MSNGAPPPPPVPGTAAAKKGLSPLAWVAIGCGSLVVVGIVVFLALGMFAFKKGKEVVEGVTGSEGVKEFMQDLQDNPAKAAAEAVIRVTPELDHVKTDDEAGTITFRNNQTGEEATLNFQDIAEGRFSMSTAEGEYSIDASGQAEGGITFSGPEGKTRFGTSASLEDVPDWVLLYPGGKDAQSTFSTTSADTVVGALVSKTGDDAQTVVDHYKQFFEDEGYTIGPQSMTTTGDGAFGAITGEKTDEGRSINIAVIEQKGETAVTINYNATRQ